MHLRQFILLPFLATLALAQDPSPLGSKAVSATNQAVEPAVTRLDATRYQIGEVIFDQKTREIRFPAQVNMTEGLLEYLVVHQNGKVHESLLSTDVSPARLNLAFNLLRYSPSKELYPLPNETGGTSNKFPEVPANVKAAARVNIEVEWSHEGKIRRVPVNEWIQHAVKTTAMPAGPWVYGGSDFHEGIFVAETTGDIISIFLSMAALVNYPGEDYEDDTVWMPFPKRVPPEGTKVTVIIAPYQNTKPLPKP